MEEGTSGTESYCANDGSTGLRDKLLSDYVSGNTEHLLRSDSQLSTYASDDDKMVDGDTPTNAGILILCVTVYVYAWHLISAFIYRVGHKKPSPYMSANFVFQE